MFALDCIPECGAADVFCKRAVDLHCMPPLSKFFRKTLTSIPSAARNKNRSPQDSLQFLPNRKGMVVPPPYPNDGDVHELVLSHATSASQMRWTSHASSGDDSSFDGNFVKGYIFFVLVIVHIDHDKACLLHPTFRNLVPDSFFPAEEDRRKGLIEFRKILNGIDTMLEDGGVILFRGWVWLFPTSYVGGVCPVDGGQEEEKMSNWYH